MIRRAELENMGAFGCVQKRDCVLTSASKNGNAAQPMMLLVMFSPDQKSFQLWAPALSAVLAVASSSCSFRDAEVIKVTAPGGKIDLGSQLPGHWERVCILMPYVTSGQAKKILGFSYVPELHSRIYALDDRTLLVTIANGKAVGSYEVLRANADFTQVGSSCYSRSQAVFDYRGKEGGWNEVSAT